MCGAYGWISETAVSAAKRAPGSPSPRPISLTSSITAAIGVLITKRRPMSSDTFAIVAWALRTSGPSPGSPAGSGRLLERDPPELVQEAHHALDAVVLPLRVLVDRAEEQQSTGGRRRRRSAPMNSSGSTTFPFDFDIFAPR